MYSLQSLSAEATMEKMYPMNGSLNKEENMSSPRKGNMFHSVLNTIWERFIKVPASFIASINYPLSVIIVNNEGIPQDILKSLTNKRESLDNENMYNHNACLKESLNFVDNIHNNMFDESKHYISKIFREDTEDSLKFSYEWIDGKKKSMKISNEGDSIYKKNIKSNTFNCNNLISIQNSDKGSDEESFEYIYPDTDTEEVSTGTNCCDTDNNSNKNTPNKEQFPNCINNSTEDTETISFISNKGTQNIQSVQETAVPSIFRNMYKFLGGVTDRFYRVDTAESHMTMKRSFSPKQRRKLNAVAKGRGRGRGKSQLRRSGVSQTRHRKKHTKHDLYDTEESNEFEDCFILDEDTIDVIQCTLEEPVHPRTYTFGDVQPKIQKQKGRKNIDQGVPKLSGKMKCISECTEKMNIFDLDFVENRYNLQKKTFRPRLISESSIDSEDSYCIVFEADSEVTCISDLEDNEESDIDETSDDDKTFKAEESVSHVQKVKFDLNPVVHVMIQWDFAYRAARKGPWEEMARDRERFRGRINCIERVLNPILTVQHRTHIWQERFALTE
ncbi:protein phosphatase 1 regulatory subunit 15 [Xylocopa sonorina]|uniref:protein phosphatase 1 regulatory subunit 15 n=1 Tax=Xylocopa sonorina TaxID=1818115 RepID=UPI00403A8E50